MRQPFASVRADGQGRIKYRDRHFDFSIYGAHTVVGRSCVVYDGLVATSRPLACGVIGFAELEL